MEKTKKAGLVVLRVGLALVFLWFAYAQLTDTAAWITYVPESVVRLAPFSVETLVRINGAFELVFGSTLLVGFFPAVSALLLALHVLHITVLVGYSAVGVRDFGLTVSTAALFLLSL